MKEILLRLNPEAHILQSQFGKISAQEILHTRLFDEEKASRMAGWIKEIQGVHTPETEEYGISSFVYRVRRPFHPHRFREVLEESWAGILRAKGFIWLATKHDLIGIYSQAGNCISLDPARPWYAALDQKHWPEDEESLQTIRTLWQEPFGDRMQEMVFIGQNLNRSQIESALNSCLLTDEEMTVPVAEWKTRFEDPFGAWEIEENEELFES